MWAAVETQPTSCGLMGKSTVISLYRTTVGVRVRLRTLKYIIDKIVSALTTMGLEQVVIGMEATGICGDNLIYALREDGSLGRFRRKIHVLNPKQVSKFKESYSDLPKNDDVDAFVIADKLRFGRITKEIYRDDYRYKALQTLTRTRFDTFQKTSV